MKKEQRRKLNPQQIDGAPNSQTSDKEPESWKTMDQSMIDLDEGMSWTGSSQCPMQITPTRVPPLDLDLEEQTWNQEKLNESQEKPETRQVLAKATQGMLRARSF